MAVDHLVHVRVLAAHDVGRQIDDDVGRIGERGAFAGADADAQRHLVRAAEVAVAQELVDRRVRNEARVDQHRVVRLVLAERGLAVDDERAHRRAEALGREQHRFGERRLGDVGDAVQRVADDVELELRLGLGGDVLPAAAAATLAGVDARRRRRARARPRAPRRTRPRRWSGRSAVTSMRPARRGGRRRSSATRPSSARPSASPPATMRVAVSSTRTSVRICETRSARLARIVKALRVHELGEPEQVMVLEDGPEPEVRPGDVRLRVHAASLNFPDVLMCRGEYQVKPPLPFTPGAEVAGVVDELGDGRRRLRGRRPGARDPELRRRRIRGVDDRVAAGGVFPIPESMPFAAGAALHVVYQTGHLALHRRAHLQPGRRCSSTPARAASGARRSSSGSRPARA